MTSAIVIDDDRDLAETISELLEADNIKVPAIGFDGEDAFQLYEKHRPDFVILDMKMPNYDGGYALEKIKIHYPNAKVIVVTGYTDYQFEKVQADALLYKPVSTLKIIKKINELTIQTPLTV